MTERERDNAMLTSGNRNFLKNGGQGMSRAGQKDHRDTIRKRVGDTLLDFHLLQEEGWPQDQREQAIEEFFSSAESSAVALPALQATVAFCLEAAGQRGVSMTSVFESAVEEVRGRDLSENERVVAEAELVTKILDEHERSPPVASAADKLTQGLPVSELEPEEQSVILQFIDEKGVTTDEIEADELLAWRLEQ